MEKEVSISDYSDYDYKTDYWVKENRDYENLCEQRTITRLLRSIHLNNASIADLGCGFGRLYPAYKDHTSQQYLIDYAQHLLDSAKKDIQSKTTQFIQGSFYNLPLKENHVDIALTIRTLHHMQDPERFFIEVHRILKNNGYFILEIPNKRNILTILRFIIGKSPFNPFSQKPYSHNETFINFHPNHIKKLLNKAGFKLVKTKNTNFLRLPFLKKILPLKLMLLCDKILQSSLSSLNLSPSVILLVQKK